MKSNVIAPLSCWFAGLLLLLPATVAQAEIAVIAHPSNSQHAVTINAIADMYLGKLKHFSDGKLVKPAGHSKGSSIRKKFNKSVLKMDERAVNRYWAKRKYTGKVKPPRTMANDNEIKVWVANTPEALGYIEGKSLDSSVKVLLILP